MAKNTNKILVQREPFEVNGKEYYTYFITGNVRGKDIRVAVIPPDKGGYTVLDIVFLNEMACELQVKPFEMKDAAGKTISGSTYSVVSFDEDGTAYECPIKPFRNSDKALLNMLLR